MNKILFLILILIISLKFNASFASVPSSSLNGNGTLQNKYQTSNIAYAEQLKLSERQIRQAYEIKIEAQKEMQPYNERLDEICVEANDIKTAKLTDMMKRQKLKKIMREINGIKFEMSQIRRNSTRDFEKILTVKQRRELDVIKNKKRKSHSNRNKHITYETKRDAMNEKYKQSFCYGNSCK
ncbi:MAG: hypothetical protein R3Y28_04650 [Candidatus Gastranaerophilales bacterium]